MLVEVDVVLGTWGLTAAGLPLPQAASSAKGRAAAKMSNLRRIH